VNGFYHFDNLVPGSYTVSEAQPAGYLDGKDTAGSTGGSNAVNDVLSSITLVSGANSVENNFGEIVTASLGDRLWTDTNANGKQDSGEAGIVGQTVTLIGGGADGLINGVGDTTTTTTTGADGIYNFTGLTPASSTRCSSAHRRERLHGPECRRQRLRQHRLRRRHDDGQDADRHADAGREQHHAGRCRCDAVTARHRHREDHQRAQQQQPDVRRTTTTKTRPTASACRS
jgi:hypothetical protein